MVIFDVPVGPFHRVVEVLVRFVKLSGPFITTEKEDRFSLAPPISALWSEIIEFLR